MAIPSSVEFSDILRDGLFWSSTEKGGAICICRPLINGKSEIFRRDILTLCMNESFRIMPWIHHWFQNYILQYYSNFILSSIRQFFNPQATDVKNTKCNFYDMFLLCVFYLFYIITVGDPSKYIGFYGLRTHGILADKAVSLYIMLLKISPISLN